MESSDRQSIIAPAKLNLTLSVLGRRPDGYHELESVVAKITLYDGIDVVDTAGPAIQITCTDRAIPSDAQNTVWRAVELARERCDDPPGLHVTLHKRIPSAAGLGGGSSDAAAMLLLLNQRWRLGLSPADLRELGSAIGSDVAAFLVPDTVLMRGRGEQVHAVQLPWDGWLVVVTPPFGIATAAVYRAWRGQPAHGPGAAQRCLDPQYQRADSLERVLFNDLEECAYRVEPRLQPLKQQLEEYTTRTFHVTGSGSSLFTCLDTHEEAQQVQERIEQSGRFASRIARVISQETVSEGHPWTFLKCGSNWSAGPRSG